MSNLYVFGSNIFDKRNLNESYKSYKLKKLSFVECTNLSTIDANEKVREIVSVSDNNDDSINVERSIINIIKLDISWHLIFAISDQHDVLVWQSSDSQSKTKRLPNGAYNNLAVLGSNFIFYDFQKNVFVIMDDDFRSLSSVAIKLKHNEDNTINKNEHTFCKEEAEENIATEKSFEKLENFEEKFIDIKCTEDGTILFLTESKVLFIYEGEILTSKKSGFLHLSKLSFDSCINMNNEGLFVSPKIKQVSCGKQHTVCLTILGVLYSFGNGNQGQLGLGTVESRKTPELIEALNGIQIVKVSAGGWHNLAISDSGDIYSWGWNNFGQLGLYCTFDDDERESNKNNIKDENLGIDKYDSSDYAIESTQLVSTKIQTYPHLVNLPPKLDKNLQASNSESLNSTAELKENEKQEKKIEIEIDEDNFVIDIACGSRHSLCLTEDNEVYSWGWNKYGQLGYKTNNNSQWKPQKINFFSNYKVKSIYAGAWNSVIDVIGSI